MLESNQFSSVLSVLASLKEGQSKTLKECMDFYGVDLGKLLKHLQYAAQKNPDDRVLTQYKDLLLHLDNYSDGWLTTARCSRKRRNKIYETLGIEGELSQFSERECPFPSEMEQPVIIAEESHHPDWYKTHGQNFYFSHYLDFLKTEKGFGTESLLGMEHSTKRVMELLADPHRTDSYQSKGLVVGYVQSGKTANFIGVCARAADAGYKLIVILAGLTKILRHQSQRRIDKDLLGKDFCETDVEYARALPADWDQFIRHNIDKAPGHPKWERLTTIGDNGEYAPLGTNISRLKFERKDKSAPLYDPINLHALPVTLAVIKKSPQIISRLIKDLEISGTKLNELPCLIIDDESDQASLNTASLPVEEGVERERTETNKKITELINKLPRAQYVGYTATPYANALVSPEDEIDLFPKDFIISLEKPNGYMGVQDFFDDPEIPDEELRNNEYLSKEKSFIREVTGDDHEDGNLKKAFCSFVISGAIKLYRQKHVECQNFPHHTMLVHTSHIQSKHDNTKQTVDDIFESCAFSTPTGMKLLEEEWNEYSRVSKIHGQNYLTPPSFDDLTCHITECLDKIQSPEGISLLLNSSTNSNDAPKWEETPIWKIIIGGNKLSRGYTIEGLTISYYRRTAKMADTIMQMGRWFGHRSGYSDLVRLYIGTEEQDGKRTINLLDAYKDLCTMEEHLRADLKQYKKKNDGRLITPRDIPPLIRVVSNIKPTARNKRLAADIVDQNYSAKRKEHTLAPTDPSKKLINLNVTENLLASAKSLGEQSLGGTFSDNSKTELRAFVWTASLEKINKFLDEYQWSKTIAEFNLERKFLRDNLTLYARFVILLFMKQESFGTKWLSKYKVSRRGRKATENSPFKAFSDKKHRAIAQQIAQISDDNKESYQLVEANREIKQLLTPERNQGVLLLYPVREEQTDEISIGFTTQHPENSLEYHLRYGAVPREQLVETGS